MRGETGLFSQVYPNARTCSSPLWEQLEVKADQVPRPLLVPAFSGLGVNVVTVHLKFSKSVQLTQLASLVIVQEIYLKFNLYIVTLSTTFGEVCSARDAV